MISYRCLGIAFSAFLAISAVQADSFTSDSLSAYYLHGVQVYNSGCSGAGPDGADCSSSLPMGIRTTASAGYGQNGLFREGIAFARVDTAAVESDHSQYYYSAGSASFTVSLVIDGGSGTGLMLPDCQGVALWGSVSCATALPVVGSYFQFTYGEPFQISGKVTNGVSEWNAFTSWILLRSVNVYDSQSNLMETMTEAPASSAAAETVTWVPEPASWALGGSGLPILLWYLCRHRPRSQVRYNSVL